jgi:hypothetical protein
MGDWRWVVLWVLRIERADHLLFAILMNWRAVPPVLMRRRAGPDRFGRWWCLWVEPLCRTDEHLLWSFSSIRAHPRS